MIKKLAARLNNQRGDTIVEVLVALTVGALALTLLAMAISATSGMAMSGEERMNQLYSMEETLANETPTSECAGTVSILYTNGDSAYLSEENPDVSYCLPSVGQVTSIPVVSYKVE